MTETELHPDHGIDPASYERRWMILGVLCLSLVLVVAAVSSVNVAIPSIRTQLEPSDTQLLWIVDIYAVVFAGLLLPAGALGDKFGRKGALQLGLIIFGIASLLSSQAGSPTVLLAFRCLMGVGAALIMPSTLSLLTSVFPPHERPKAIAVWTGFAGAGAVIGTLVGGLVLTHFWWGSVFFVSVPIADHRPRDGHDPLSEVQGVQGGAARPDRRGAVGDRLRFVALRHHRRPREGLGLRAQCGSVRDLSSLRSHCSSRGSAARHTPCSTSASSGSLASGPARSA